MRGIYQMIRPSLWGGLPRASIKIAGETGVKVKTGVVRGRGNFIVNGWLARKAPGWRARGRGGGGG